MQTAEYRAYPVLYVDDEPANRNAFERTFRDRFTIHCVASAAEALDYLKDHAVAVLVTDQRMPRMSGNELLERAKVLHPNTVRVVITAYGDLDPILSAVNEGLVARYVIKPWRRQEVEQILQWGVEAYTLGEHDSALQLRLMQTERLVTLGSIGATVMHDLNQPLAYVSSNAQRLQTLAQAMPALDKALEMHPEVFDSKQAQALKDLVEELGPIVDDLQTGCNLMQGLTTSIRRLLRPSTREEAACCDPTPVVRYAMAVCKEIAIRSRSKLTFDGATDLPKVAMGQTELTQVLINVIANATQATGRRDKPGGRVLVTAQATDDSVRLAVIDDGPGMSKEVLARVGTPFFSTRPEGTGLGVAQCKRLIEREGGLFHIASTPDVGTTVTITVPQA